MMRCSVCNGYGYTAVTKEEAARRGDCPPGVLAAVDEFFACRSCGKLYWEGPKSQGAFGTFSQMFDGFAGSTGESHAPSAAGHSEVPASTTD